MEALLLEKKDHFCFLRLNRPEAMNALNTAMAIELLTVAQELALDRDIWVIGITSTLDKAFGVGADLKERKDMTAEQMAQQRILLSRCMQALKAVPQPVIAGVKGFALGAGFEIALLADLIIAGENAQFGLPEARVGLIPANGGTQTLARLIGRNKAKELIFTGRRVSAGEALALGIVSRVVPTERVEEEVFQIGREICANAPIAVRQAKKAIDLGVDLDFQTGLRIELEAFHVNLSTKDRQEGIRAFNEKRPPQWENR